MELAQRGSWQREIVARRGAHRRRSTEREEEEASGFGKNAAACRHVVKVNLVPTMESGYTDMIHGDVL